MEFKFNDPYLLSEAGGLKVWNPSSFTRNSIVYAVMEEFTSIEMRAGKLFREGKQVEICFHYYTKIRNWKKGEWSSL